MVALIKTTKPVAIFQHTETYYISAILELRDLTLLTACSNGTIKRWCNNNISAHFLHNDTHCNSGSYNGENNGVGISNTSTLYCIGEYHHPVDEIVQWVAQVDSDSFISATSKGKLARFRLSEAYSGRHERCLCQVDASDSAGSRSITKLIALHTKSSQRDIIERRRPSLATCGGKTIKLWSTSASVLAIEHIQTLEGHSQAVVELNQLDTDILLSSSLDGTVRAWSLVDGGSCIKVIARCHTNKLLTLDVNLKTVLAITAEYKAVYATVYDFGDTLTANRDKHEDSTQLKSDNTPVPQPKVASKFLIDSYRCVEVSRRTRTILCAVSASTLRVYSYEGVLLLQIMCGVSISCITEISDGTIALGNSLWGANVEIWQIAPRYLFIAKHKLLTITPLLFAMI